MGLFDDHNAKVCVVFSTPLAKVTGPNGQLIYDPISPLWHRARAGLSTGTNINVCEIHADGLEVGDARSQIAARCLSMNPRPEFLFFIDSDVLVPVDGFTKLLFRARCFPDYDVFAGVYCAKGVNPPDPLIYRKNGQGAYWDWTVGDLLTTDKHDIEAVHSGLTLIRVDIFDKLKEAGIVHGDGTNQEDKPFYSTIYSRTIVNGQPRLQTGTEDIFFCDCLRQLREKQAEQNVTIRGKILVDTSVLAGHVDKSTGIVYGLPYGAGPVARAKWLANPNGDVADQKEADEHTEPCECNKNATCVTCNGTGVKSSPRKLALDIGAGNTRRHWDGHNTYTTDIRADANPDYVMDTRLLNFPDGHFDLVASRHHLEHVGRWDQEIVWREMFRIIKPGGRIEHIVPNIDWAAHKIIAKDVDQHVMNVLYGAQESHGYDRQFNLHYFGYTKKVAEELASVVGFTDIVCTDFHDNPDLGYDLIITGRKPTNNEIVSDTTVSTCCSDTTQCGVDKAVSGCDKTVLTRVIDEQSSIDYQND